MSVETCPGSGKWPRSVNGIQGTGWCSRCRDQHVITNGLIPHHNTERNS